MEDITRWLLQDCPWMEYRVRTDLLEENETCLKEARQKVIKDEKVQNLLNNLLRWPGEKPKSHQEADDLIHKLVFIADLGLKIEDEPVKRIVEKVMLDPSPKGPFKIPVDLSSYFIKKDGGNKVWLMCDAPLIVYSLWKLGLEKEPSVKKALDYLLSLGTKQGWHCAGASSIGKFCGPGNKKEICPYATLLMLRLLAAVPDLRNSRKAKEGTEVLLDLWERRMEKRPKLFAMRNDFCKIRAPLIWYDILHLLEVLSQFSWVKTDERFLEMQRIIENRKDENGRYKADSVWRSWENWEFSQKEEPSRWITFLIFRIAKRLEQ